MDWSVDLVSGHCAHSEGLTAFLDVGKEGSCFIRCLGPFGYEMLDHQKVLLLMKSLTELLESSIGANSKFVVWGSYLDQPDYWEHEFPIQGSLCGFMPNLALRELVLDCKSSMGSAFSWRKQEGLLVHRSGLRIDQFRRSIDASYVDPQLLHPDHFQSQVRQLAALYLVRRASGVPSSLKVEAGSLSWSKLGRPLRVVN